jgi:PPOX class probable F420-dependent enzyme
MAELSDKARELVDGRNLAFLATLDPDGSPQVSPVWIDREDGRLLVNAAVGRVKDRNMRREPRVAISIVNRDDENDHVDIRGRVVEVVEGDAAESHVDKLAMKYMGEETYPMRKERERRVIFKIEPERVNEGS